MRNASVCNFLSELPVSSCRNRCTVSVIRNDNARCRVACMDNLSISHIDRYMADSAAAAVEQKVSSLNAAQIYRCAASGLGCRCTRNANAKVCKYGLCKSGTVSTIRKTCAAPYVRVAYKLYRKVHNLLSQRGRGSGILLSLGICLCLRICFCLSLGVCLCLSLGVCVSLCLRICFCLSLGSA